ncbi:MAG: GNAT family N-acetyltransferase [Candidatus Binatia bacterium]
MTQLRTTRLALFPYQETDIAGLHRVWIDPGVRKYLWDEQLITLATAAEVVQAGIQDWATHHYGQWTVRLPQHSEIIGFCGFRASQEDDHPELLYGLLPTYWGQGFATEASLAALQYIFVQRHLARIWAATDPPNVASVRVMERLGMQFARRGLLNGLDTVFYVLSREQFFVHTNHRHPQGGSTE